MLQGRRKYCKKKADGGGSILIWPDYRLTINKLRVIDSQRMYSVWCFPDPHFPDSQLRSSSLDLEAEVREWA
jgi:hypothetical protein